MKYKVYKHTSPSGNSYVGYTKLTVEERWRKKINEIKDTNQPLANALRKYGRENWQHEILFETDDIKIAHKKEKEFIREFGYYNIAEGGEGGNTGRNHEKAKVEKQRRKISQHWKDLPEEEKQRRINNSIETRKKNGTLGNNNPHYGEKHGHWTGYWYIFNVPYTTLKEAAELTNLNESTIIDLCINRVDKVQRRTSKMVQKGKTPRECGHYRNNT